MKLSKQDKARIATIRTALMAGKTVGQINGALCELGLNVQGVPHSVKKEIRLSGGYDYYMVIETYTTNPAWQKAKRLCKQTRGEWSPSAAEMLFGPEMRCTLSHVLAMHEDENGVFTAR